jgi:hypothetical protein
MDGCMDGRISWMDGWKDGSMYGWKQNLYGERGEFVG